MHQLFRLAIDGLRSLVLLKPRPEAFAAPVWAHLSFYLLYLVTLAALEAAAADSPRIFDANGISAIIAALCVSLALLSLLPFRRHGASPERIMLGSGAAVLPSFAVAAVAVVLLKRFADSYFREAEFIGATIFGVVILIIVVWDMVVTFRLIVGMTTHRRVPLAFGGLIALTVSSFMLPDVSMISGKNDTSFDFSLAQFAADSLRPARVKAPAKSADAPPPVDGEAVMMRQHALVADAVASLAPARASQPELYFVGFAPYSWQDVFKREVTAVKALFDERFGTTGRSIVLQNHRESVADIPLASVSNLEVVLGQIGQRMQRDRDVLVLFVTSHGAERVISVAMEGVRLNSLTPARLTKALDQAGIKNRVLILSACYSGSFVPPLSNENTMILTAASAERTSFG
ncbi:MAG: C13 family peptidase [Hyphomicrobiaceae bacterium]